MGRHRAYCFTINNPTRADHFAISLLMKKAKYGIVGKEKGTKEGTEHLQGYVSLVNALSFEKLKACLPRAHIEVSGGTDEDNFKYCSKDGDYEEWGMRGAGQGSRTDIKEIANLIKSGDITLTDIMFDYPDMYLKYSRSFEKMFNAVQKPRTEKPEVIWRWGLAGVGKTRWVMDKHGAKNVYVKDNTLWWDGYNQQDVILIDDFDNKIPFRILLRIIDRYQYQGQVKGSYVEINSPFIIITCEHPPDYFWEDNELAQVVRRLTSVVEVK